MAYSLDIREYRNPRFRPFVIIYFKAVYVPFRNFFRRIAIRLRDWEVVFSLPAIARVALRTLKFCFSLTEVCCFCVLRNESLFR